MKSKLPLIIAAIVALITLIVLIFVIPPGKKPQAKKGTPVRDTTAAVVVKAKLTPQQKQDLPQILRALKDWDTKYKKIAGSITATEVLSKSLASYPPKYEEDLSKGSILHLLGNFLITLPSTENMEEEDLMIINELSAYYNGLRNEPDPVSVTIINRSASPVQYLDSSIRPGGSLRVEVNGRKLGETDIAEGAFAFQDIAFVFNPALETQPGWDQDRYRWKPTGRSSYQLEVLK